MTVQFHIPEWDSKEAFARDYRASEALCGFMPTDLDVDRAYARYKALACEEVDPEDVLPSIF